MIHEIQQTLILVTFSSLEYDVVVVFVFGEQPPETRLLVDEMAQVPC